MKKRKYNVMFPLWIKQTLCIQIILLPGALDTGGGGSGVAAPHMVL